MKQVSLFEDDSIKAEGDSLECNTCLTLKPLIKFQQMPSGEIKRKCRDCQAHESKVREALKLSNKYPDEDYTCPVCTRSIEEVAKRGQQKLQKWVLDHCHDTDQFRGWICFNCNTGLGAFKDNVDTLKRAVEYLENN